MRIDPTRTTLLRRQWVGAINRRWTALRRAVRQYLVVDDEMGLDKKNPLQLHAGEYQFANNPDKLAAFNKWLDSQVKAKVLSVDETGKYVDSAYRKGMVRAYTDTNKKKLAKDQAFYKRGRAEFLGDTMAQPEVLEKVRLLATRAMEGMKGVTEAEKSQITRILADGLAHGRSARDVARDIDKRIEMGRGRAIRVARTEIIHSHAEGQLDSFKELGVEELGVLAEVSTADDNDVCEKCEKLAEDGPYSIEDARGMIPAHPNCRCSWLPHVKEPG